MEKKLSTADILAAARAASAPVRVSTSRPVRKVHELRVDEADEEAIRRAIVEFWQTVIAVTKAQQSEAWDIIVCRLEDSGWIHAAAAKCQLPFQFPKLYGDLDASVEHFHFPAAVDGVSLYVAEHERKWYEIGDRCGDDNELEFGLRQLAERRLQLLRNGAADVASQLGSLPIRGVFAAFESETLSEVDLIPLIGQPLPRPEPPVTALEVFSRLYHQTHRAVGKNCGLNFDQEELVTIRLTGRDTSDATIALLEEVDRLQEVCRNVRQIDLTNSNVTNHGFAHLKRLLPHVEILQ